MDAIGLDFKSSISLGDDAGNIYKSQYFETVFRFAVSDTLYQKFDQEEYEDIVKAYNKNMNLSQEERELLLNSEALISAIAKFRRALGNHVNNERTAVNIQGKDKKTQVIIDGPGLAFSSAQSGTEINSTGHFVLAIPALLFCADKSLTTLEDQDVKEMLKLVSKFSAFCAKNQDLGSNTQKVIEELSKMKHPAKIHSLNDARKRIKEMNQDGKSAADISQVLTEECDLSTAIDIFQKVRGGYNFSEKFAMFIEDTLGKLLGANKMNTISKVEKEFARRLNANNETRQL